jgi:protoporphyrin/coproporphyrin ferrochelatase
VAYDAFLLLSFGGPEAPADVMPFLENVTRGRGVPPERLASVAEHYHRFGGVSPINGCNRALIEALRPTLDLPIYWGNRNWHPFLPDTVRQMAADGVRRAVCFTTSAYSGYSACRQYREDIARARDAVPGAPVIDKLRPFFDHPGFIGPFADATVAALAKLPPGSRPGANLVFTAHSIPLAQSVTSAYSEQIEEACRLVAGAVADGTGDDHPWALVWQSRSGPPTQPWLEPDVIDHLTALADAGTRAVVVVPIGFVADHLEVVYDLDTVAAAHAASLGVEMVRAATPGTAPAFVEMVGSLIAEREHPAAPRVGLGRLETSGLCDEGCCPPPQARPRVPSA